MKDESYEDYRARMKAEKRAVSNRQRYGRNYLHVSTEAGQVKKRDFGGQGKTFRKPVTTE